MELATESGVEAWLPVIPFNDSERPFPYVPAGTVIVAFDSVLVVPVVKPKLCCALLRVFALLTEYEGDVAAPTYISNKGDVAVST
jgi:hypothetical protein